MPSVTAGKTDHSVYFYIVGDSSHASPGDPVTGLAFGDIETGGDASYMRQGAARVDAGTVITQTVAGAHSDGGFIEVDATDMPGVYRFDPPDAAWATGVDFVIIQIVVASANDAVAAPLQIDITDVDLRDSVRAGLTSLPNAAAEAAGGLATSSGGATGIDDLATPTNITAGTITTVTTLTNLPAITANWLTATGINADAITAAKIADDSITSDQLGATAVTDIWALQVESEGTYTAQQAMSIILAALAGVSSGGGSTLETPNGVADRIVATIDGSNNRTAMTLTPSS